MRAEEALEEARRAAADARARGAFGDDLSGFAVEPSDRVSIERLIEWAVIELDPDLVRSTRRYGRPITAVKRALRHVLRQDLGQAYAQQTRFNLHAAMRLAELEDRLEQSKRDA